MIDQIKIWYRGLQPREKMLVNAAAALLSIAIIYLAFFGPLSKVVRVKQERVERKQQDLVWMRGVANSVRMAAASRPSGMNNESMVVLVNRTAQQSGLANSLTSQAPQGDNSIRVRMENAQFDSMVNWLGLLEQQYGVQVDNASVDRGDKSGIVNASFILTRGGKQ